MMQEEYTQPVTDARQFAKQLFPSGNRCSATASPIVLYGCKKIRNCFNFAMTTEPNRQNAPHATEIVTIEQLDAISLQLQKWADEIKFASDTAKGKSLTGIACYYLSSAELGMKRFKAFTNALEESRLALQMGKPFEVGKLKPRSTAKRPNKTAKEIKAMIDEDKKTLDAHRASKKKSPPE